MDSVDYELIHCPSCRCEIAVEEDGQMKKQLRDGVPLQRLIECQRCPTKFILTNWGAKQ